MSKDQFGYLLSEMDLEAFMNIRQWLTGALQSAGADIEASGIGAGVATVCISLDGARYDVVIRPLGNPSGAT